MAGDFLSFAERVPFLRTLTPDDLGYLKDAVHHVSLGDGEVLYRPGQPPDGLYIVESGRLDVTVPGKGGIEVRLAEMAPGTVVGELSLVDRQARAELVRAREETTLFRVDANWVWDLRTQMDPLAFKIMRAVSFKICGSLRNTTESFARISDENYEALDPGLFETKDKRPLWKKLLGK